MDQSEKTKGDGERQTYARLSEIGVKVRSTGREGVWWAVETERYGKEGRGGGEWNGGVQEVGECAGIGGANGLL